MAFAFEEALQFVLKWEGFISNDPHDPGQLTIWGISYKSHREKVLEMEKLLDEGKKVEAFEIAKKIYFENYWKGTDCDIWDFPLNLIVFDTAVNLGVSRAKIFNLTNRGWLDYLFLRIDYYTKLENFKYFGRGWINRVIALYNLIKIEMDK